MDFRVAMVVRTTVPKLRFRDPGSTWRGGPDQSFSDSLPVYDVARMRVSLHVASPTFVSRSCYRRFPFLTQVHASFFTCPLHGPVGILGSAPCV